MRGGRLVAQPGIARSMGVVRGGGGQALLGVRMYSSGSGGGGGGMGKGGSFISRAQAAARSLLDRARATSSGPSVGLPFMGSVMRPMEAVGAARRALMLRVQSFYRNNAFTLTAIGTVMGSLLLWRVMYGTANLFINMSETFAELGLLVTSISVSALGVLYLRHRHALDPEAVYRLSMRALNQDPRVLELLGAPLEATELRAFVMSGGRLRVGGNLLPKISSRRCHLIFPLQGKDMRGIVSAEAKKKRGKYVFKMLCVDVPTVIVPRVGSTQAPHSSSTSPSDREGEIYRIFLHGSQEEYDKGKIMRELRDPFLQAAESENEHEIEEDSEELDEMRKRRETIMEMRPKPLSQGGGMFEYERAYETAIGAAGRARSTVAKFISNFQPAASKPRN